MGACRWDPALHTYRICTNAPQSMHDKLALMVLTLPSILAFEDLRSETYDDVACKVCLNAYVT